MSATFLFVSGMFRSGTTMLGRMLNAHPQVAVASDPYLPLLKTFRSDVAGDLGQTVGAAEPLSDYYFSADGLRLFESIQQAAFDRPFASERLDELRRQVRAYGEPYSPKLMPHLDRIGGATYRDVLRSMIDLVAAEYATADSTVVGFKEVWADEFIPCLARSLPDAKFIQIVRDVRAVCASKNVSSARYPWLFLCRQWRKLAALAWSYGRGDGPLAGRVLVLRYEDLVTRPQETAESICGFLGLPFAEAMVDPGRYVDGAGKPWMQNTSYGGGGQAFSTAGLDKWRKILSDDEVALIETLCGPEMTLHGYELHEPRDGVSERLLLHPPCVPKEELANWIRDAVVSDPVAASLAMGAECVRWALLGADEAAASEADQALVRQAFLTPEVLAAARQAKATDR